MPVFLFLLFLSLPSRAQVRWGIRGGVADSEAMIGADVIMKVASSIYFNPGVEVSSENVTVNADGHYDFEITRDAAVWLGAGLALVIPDEGDLDPGVNLIAGIGTRSGRYIFYTQAKKTRRTDGDDFNTLAVGIRF